MDQDPVKRPVEFLTSTPPITRARKTVGGSVALTQRQLEVLAAIRRFVKEHRITPTRDELRAEIGLRSQGGVDSHLASLTAKGWLTTKLGLERSITLLREGVPLYEPEALRRAHRGTQLRGEPRPPEAEWIDCEKLWDSFGAMPDLLIWIRGEAMIRAGLSDGGIVALARPCDDEGRVTVAHGDIVAARTAEDVMMRRVRAIDARTVELHAESTSRRHKTMRYDTRTEDVEIIGVVIGRILAGAGRPHERKRGGHASAPRAKGTPRSE